MLLKVKLQHFLFLIKAVFLCLNQSEPTGDTVEDTEQSLEDLMAQMRKL